MSTPALNPLVTKIRAMHPGAYDDMDDGTLTKAVLAKYPQYSDLAAPPASAAPGGPKSQPPMQESNLATALSPNGEHVANPQQPAESFALEHPEQQGPLAGAAAIGAAGALGTSTGAVGVVRGAIAKQMAEHPVLGPTVASYLISKAREIPGVGHLIPSGAEIIPFLAGHGKGEPVPPENPGAPFPEVPPEELRQGSALFRGAKPGVDPSAGLGNIPRGSIAANFKDPGAPLPTAPEPQLTQGTSLLYGPRAVKDPAAGLSSIPVKRELPAAFQPLPPKATPPIGTADNPFKSGQIAEAMKPPAAQTPAPPFQRGQLSKLLDEHLSKATNAAPPLNPKEPIYKRGSIAQQVNSAPSEHLTPVLQKSLDQVNAAKDLPEGHTPLTSSAMKSYKYDPAAREFHARMTSGDTTYVYGDVSPEDAQAFEAAESKGKALPQIKRNPLVAKIVNGKRVAVKPGPTR